MHVHVQDSDTATFDDILQALDSFQTHLPASATDEGAIVSLAIVCPGSKDQLRVGNQIAAISATDSNHAQDFFRLLGANLSAQGGIDMLGPSNDAELVRTIGELASHTSRAPMDITSDADVFACDADRMVLLSQYFDLEQLAKWQRLKGAMWPPLTASGKAKANPSGSTSAPRTDADVSAVTFRRGKARAAANSGISSGSPPSASPLR